MIWPLTTQKHLRGKAAKNSNAFIFYLHIPNLPIYHQIIVHSSQFQGLCSMKCSRETLQNLLNYMSKPRVTFSIFRFLKLKMKRLTLGSHFSFIIKDMENFTAFRWNFSVFVRHAQTLKLQFFVIFFSMKTGITPTFFLYI